jgi:NADH-quinone oxidoreductase subunit C
VNARFDAIAKALDPDLALQGELGQSILRLQPSQIRPVFAGLKQHGFSLLLDITAVDWPFREPRFDVIYHLYHLDLRDWLRVELQVGGEHPEVPSVAHIYASAGWAERECYDLFGIGFPGHPDLKRIMLPDDWLGHPLRKDYPVSGVGPLPPLARE